MKSIKCKIDVTKIDKSRIKERTYQDRDGKTITVKEYEFEVVPLKEPKIVLSNERYTLSKTHFLAESKTKEEREANKKTVYIGDGLQFGDLVTDGVDYPEKDDFDNFGEVPF
jgi:hypothetical protein